MFVRRVLGASARGARPREGSGLLASLTHRIHMHSELWPGRVIGVVVWLVSLACWSSNGFAIDIQPAALSEAIRQNTAGNSEVKPLGFQITGTYGTHTLTPAPLGFSALTGWGIVYREAGAPVSPNAATDTVQIANFTTYVHLTNGTWVEVQDQAQNGIGGAHYVADFANGANIPWNEQKLPDGSVSVDAPPSGYNDHFWPGVRGTFTPETVDGVFIVADMKTNDPNANLVAQIGADWWRNSTAPYVNGFANNPVVGGNNFIKLTTQWRTLYYTSLSPQELQADPPADLLSTPRPRQ
jgi:hypothetical protein